MEVGARCASAAIALTPRHAVMRRYGQEGCAQLLSRCPFASDGSGGLNDMFCNASLFFICQRDGACLEALAAAQGVYGGE